jgi:hypothetical protein
VLSLALLGVLACSGTSSSAAQATTGIVVRSEALTTGRGCGRSPTNVFKYAVVVFGYGTGPESARTSYTTPVISNVFDCFTDGAFIDLEPVLGSSTFRLEVYAYNEPAFTASRAAITAAGSDTNALRATTPTWTTECTATQQRDVQALALCDPLSPGLAGFGGALPPTRITVGTSQFHVADGRTAICGSASDAGADVNAAPSDAAADVVAVPDAQADAALDAGGGDPDASAPRTDASVTFAAARIRYRTAQAVGPVVDVACPNPFLADVPPEPARYDVEVGLVDPSGNPVGTTICTVTSQTGATSSAVCP